MQYDLNDIANYYFIRPKSDKTVKNIYETYEGTFISSDGSPELTIKWGFLIQKVFIDDILKIGNDITVYTVSDKDIKTVRDFRICYLDGDVSDSSFKRERI